VTVNGIFLELLYHFGAVVAHNVPLLLRIESAGFLKATAGLFEDKNKNEQYAGITVILILR
jgi:hypothetical protein